MKLDEFIRTEAKRRADPAWHAADAALCEAEIRGALEALLVEVARLARQDAEDHRHRAAGLGATFALQTFADGLSLQKSRV